MDCNQSPSEPSVFLVNGGLLTFVLVTLGSFYWFKLELIYILNELASNKTIQTYENVVFFGFGIGLCLSFFTFPLLYFKIFNRPKPKLKIVKILNIMLIFSTIVAFSIMLVLPHFANDYLDDYMRTKGYKFCGVPDVKMLLYRKVIYTNSQEVCAELIRKECEEYNWLCK